MRYETREFSKLIAQKILITTNYLLPGSKPLQDIMPIDKPSKYYAERMDILRFVAMCSIVWGHTLCSWADKSHYQKDYQSISIVANQLGKLGSITFFLISGYFLNKKVYTLSMTGYLKYRLNTIIIPWVIFLSLLLIIQVLHVFSFQQILTGNIVQILKYSLQSLNGFIFHAAYWYIPVSILSALVLILFKKHINKVWFGFVLLSLTLFYSINLYYNWVSALHTKAFLGYVFFLWLGIQLNQHTEKFKTILDSLSWKVLIPGFLLAFTLACFEAETLRNHYSADPFSSLRISNCFLCLLFFLVILKSNRLTFFKHLNPRKNVFGIYLVHCIIIVETIDIANKLIINQHLVSNLPGLFLVQTGFFIIIMGLTFIIVWLIHHSPIAFILGRSKNKQVKQQSL